MADVTQRPPALADGVWVLSALEVAGGMDPPERHFGEACACPRRTSAEAECGDYR